MRKKGYNGHTGLWREKSCKIIDGKQQKFEEKPLPSRREKEKFEKLFKVSLNKSNSVFKKPDSRFSIDLKQIGSIENQKKHNFRENNLIFENTPQSIENKKSNV